ncbi:hypothetical protein OOZ19_07335 [Saccharopolyspora sp. NFXS83]|uniref:hypothetical protein n=1 Tax=Saccharopolyspora sp. NFXS83 TaxID=2993560 RepID=UPI00224A8A67|nr:hypothetical protein [Saccharopolyspora sp. NFXS83]MCX2730048.1 hypothetical protein [Saccharopolyspora sp. NFXS83]
MDVLAPDGLLALVPGGAIFAGTGEHAWRLFRTGTVAQPCAPAADAGLGVGVAAREQLGLRPAGRAGARGPAAAARGEPDAGVVVPQSGQRPRVLLAPSATPAQVAAAVGPRYAAAWS